MAIAKLQQCLEQLYDISIGHDVEDFLIQDPVLASRIENNPAARRIPEKLLLHETEDSVDMALFLEKDIVDRLCKDDPMKRLHAGNLVDFLTALEGVSHFLYLAWSVAHDRSVSLLELELQAEIDKFILTTMLLAREENGIIPAGIHRFLFDEDWLDRRLSPDLYERYRAANHYARQYCGWLQRRFMRRRREAGMLSELRRFYRLTNHGKMWRIRHDLAH